MKESVNDVEFLKNKVNDLEKKLERLLKSKGDRKVSTFEIFMTLVGVAIIAAMLFFAG